MSLVDLFFIAVGLSMDAFAVAICHGLSMKSKSNFKDAVVVGLYFGGFQAAMPAIGYLIGAQFSHLIADIDHWIAFVLLGIIGANMIRESLKKHGCKDRVCPEAVCRDRECPKLAEDEQEAATLHPKRMIPLAVATSIDALAVGVSFAFIKVDIVPAVSFIGCITFVLSAIGVCLGAAFGGKFKAKAEFAGGAILILMGTKILLNHLGVISF